MASRRGRQVAEGLTAFWGKARAIRIIDTNALTLLLTGLRTGYGRFRLEMEYTGKETPSDCGKLFPVNNRGTTSCGSCLY